MKKMKIAVYPGSFDPISNGHLDIIERASRLFDKVYVVVSINILKQPLFTPTERVEMLKEVTKHLENVVVEETSELLIRYAEKRKANVIIRGLRNFIDYQSEMTLFQFNRKINSNIETILLFPSQDNLFLSSTSIKELVVFGGDISEYVPKQLVERIKKRIEEKNFRNL